MGTPGFLKAFLRGQAKGATAAADVTTSVEGSDHQALDVHVYPEQTWVSTGGSLSGGGTVVAAPASGTTRIVRHLSFTNSSASDQALTILFVVSVGVDVTMLAVTLKPGDRWLLVSGADELALSSAQSITCDTTPTVDFLASYFDKVA